MGEAAEKEGRKQAEEVLEGSQGEKGVCSMRKSQDRRLEGGGSELVENSLLSSIHPPLCLQLALSTVNIQVHFSYVIYIKLHGRSLKASTGISASYRTKSILSPP